MPHVIGTAGHVDHGKSTLVQALTGIDPDRLAEEKARGLTIDLGFAWSTLPSGREVGFVDVPGHERFVHNMLAGVGGIGCALLVVDAAEGWRPQSAEHLAILDLLGLRVGVVALTKVDLVDTDARSVVTAEIEERLRGTGLAGSEIVATAVPPGPAAATGLDDLRAALDRALDAGGEPPDRGRPRVPVDRVFSIRGSGTVVTGTLTGGRIEPETEAELIGGSGRARQGPRRVRVRALHGHGRPLTVAEPARRVAANLAGVAVEDVARGDVLVLPGQWRPTQVADARVRCLASAPAPLRGRGAYLLYAGTAEVGVRLQPLDAHEIAPGEAGLVRLHLERPLTLDILEPVVLRDSGHDETVGGGPIIDPFPAGRVRGTNAKVRRVEQLEAREATGRRGLLQQVLAERGLVALDDLPWLAAATAPALRAELDRLVGEGQAIRTRSTAWSPAAFSSARQAVLDAVAQHHRTEPLAAGAPAQLARQAVMRSAALAGGPALQPGMPTAAGSAGAEIVEALVADGLLVAQGPAVRLPSHGIQLSRKQQAARRAVERAIADAGVSALNEADLAALGADRHLAAALSRLGVLVQLVPGLWLGAVRLDAATETLRGAFPAGREFSASDARKALDTTRKTVIPLLEYLDRTGVTLRTGDTRRLRSAGPSAPGRPAGTAAVTPPPPQTGPGHHDQGTRGGTRTRHDTGTGRETRG
jgi:selenocysteine-specific elongation factor